jgi:DNA-binding GntR family transcriptional regulator
MRNGQRPNAVDGEKSPATMNLVVRERLYQDIVSGRLPAGSRLTINELSKRYQTSSTPVRSALLELEGKGLITTQPHRGATVRMIDKEYLDNLYDIRTAIISLLMPKCVKYISNADLEEARKYEAAFERAVAGGQVPEILDARRAFYRFILEIARNPEAFDIINRTWTVIDILRLRYGIDPTKIERSLASHKQLLQALVRRDAKAALAAILASNERTKADLLQLMRQAADKSANNRKR